MVNLIEHLPAEGAYQRLATGGWDDKAEMAACSLELLHALFCLTARAYGVKQHLRPLRVPRPAGVTARGRPAPAAERISASTFMNRLIAGR
jgi:hypothetical protein